MIARSLLCLATALALAGVAVPAAAAAKSDTAATSPVKKKGAKKASHKKAGHAAKVVKSPSEETRAERERRLLRECKGRPNAGACLGYAS